MSCTVQFERETCKRTSTQGELADNSRTSFPLEATHQESIGPASLYLAECRWEAWLTLMSDRGFIVYLEIRHELPSLALSAKSFDPSSLSLLLFVVAHFDSGSCCCFKWFLSPKSFHHLCFFILFYFYCKLSELFVIWATVLWRSFTCITCSASNSAFSVQFLPSSPKLK